MKKTYILQERLLLSMNHYYFDIYESDDIEYINKLYNVLDEKYYDRDYRIIEVIK